MQSSKVAGLLDLFEDARLPFEAISGEGGFNLCPTPTPRSTRTVVAMLPGLFNDTCLPFEAIWGEGGFNNSTAPKPPVQRDSLLLSCSVAGVLGSGRVEQAVQPWNLAALQPSNRVGSWVWLSNVEQCRRMGVGLWVVLYRIFGCVPAAPIRSGRVTLLRRGYEGHALPLHMRRMLGSCRGRVPRPWQCPPRVECFAPSLGFGSLVGCRTCTIRGMC